MNVVAAPGTGKSTPGKFKALQDSMLSVPGETDDAKKAETGIENGLMGIVVNLLNPAAARTDEAGNSENGQKVSICGDYRMEELISGIAGILEGFGLLNEKTDEVTLPKGLRTILEAALNQQDPQAAAKAETPAEGEIPVLMGAADLTAMSGQPDEYARMSNGSQQAEIPANAQKEIVKLVAEYLCSFANSNNNGAADDRAAESTVPGTAMPVEAAVIEKNVAHTEAGAVQTDAPAADPSKPAAEDLMTLIKTALETQKSAQEGDAAPKEARLTVKTDDKDADNTPPTSPIHAAPTQKQPAYENTAGIKKFEEALPKPTVREMADNVAKIVDKISAQLKDGQGEFEVTLKPEYLGKLSIKLSMDGDGIKASLKAADSSVKSMIANELPVLQDMLREKGLNVVKIDVTYDNPTFDTSSQQFRQNRGESNQKGKQHYGKTELPTYGLSFDAVYETDLTLLNSSVEFKA